MVSDWPLMRNLVKVAALWCCTQMAFNLNHFFLKYLPGSFFLNIGSNVSSELLSVLYLGTMSRFMDVRRTLPFSYAFLSVGAILLYIFSTGERSELDYKIIPVCLVFTALGSFGAMVGLYLSHMEMFPAVFRTTTIGFCQVSGRLFAMIAPMIAEMSEPLP